MLVASERANASDDWETAVSRAYYAVFHLIIASAVAKGAVSAQWHYEHGDVAELAGTLIPRMTVKTSQGLTLPLTGKSAYIELKGLRQAADYLVGKTDRVDAETAIGLAKNFFAALP